MQVMTPRSTSATKKLSPKVLARRRSDAERARALVKEISKFKAVCEPLGVRLLSKAEVLALTGVSYPTIWTWMRTGMFPRSRMINGSNGKSVWLSTEIEEWLAGLRLRPLKGDALEAGEAVATAVGTVKQE
jgi:predicted DNA-binding transcriptional regulator AlpA